MNREDIIRMMREAHLDVYGLGKDHQQFMSAVECVAYSAFTAGALAEREACSELCKDHAKTYAELPKSLPTDAAWAACIDLLGAIRARGQG